MSVTPAPVEGLEDVRPFYRTGEDLDLPNPPAGTAAVVARLATGEEVSVDCGDSGAHLRDLGPGTWSVEARDGEGALLAEECTTVGAHPGERPVHGFATSFQDHDVEEILSWHRALRTTVVQVYDWMASYTAPDGPETGWRDPSNRPVSIVALRELAAGLRSAGAVAHAYAPIYAVGHDFASAHPETLLYEDTGEAIRFLENIVLADPGNPAWQRHFVHSYGAAADRIGFGGFHVDTYGYPRVAYDVHGAPVDMRAGYAQFLHHLRAERPSDLISFNQVNGVPSAAELPAEPIFRYCEVWPANDRWRHLEGLLDRTSGHAGMLVPDGGRSALMRGSIACYPPVWQADHRLGALDGAARADALRTVLATEAVATMLGASALLYGDRTAVLCDPYYPKHEPLSEDEAAVVLGWRRFALRCRDLFLEGEDTSWYEIGDENGAVAVDCSVPVLPEPVGGTVFARVVQSDERVGVGLLDLTGSARGRWSERTAAGRVSSVTARVLLGHPDRWHVEVAVSGASDEHFFPVPAKVVAHRQGQALEFEVPLGSGWCVARVLRR